MEFIKFPKIPRLKRGMFVTEKIDGTNAQIYIDYYAAIEKINDCNVVGTKDELIMFAGSRNRYLTFDKDNYGFFKYAQAYSTELFKLGTGRHYGEWWGQGVQRGYDLKEKRFSLFNVGRWGRPEATLPDCVYVVPELYRGEMDISVVNELIEGLKIGGSVAAPGFMRPEGVVVFHTAMNGYFKVMCENDDLPKGKV